ncbi:MAG: type II CRISPR RNA-guided endonuclease Cas9, partial [Bifidobacteriaceae bacterium]|nr:type II CRISPR RNA-guided endonuclease Cas9 [Bifidobacteriaceae bacterium]
MSQQQYSLGLDIGNASVGFAAIDDSFHLMRAKGHEIIGARLFDPAQTAAERRGYRTNRRRLSRRRWRIRLLNEEFAPQLAQVDSGFLNRLQYSWGHPQDSESPYNQWFGSRLFDSIEADKEFYRKYPTIYHLRKALMTDDAQHDIREVYLAIHHIVKFRGNFLTEGDLQVEKVFTAEENKELINKVLQLDNSNNSLVPNFDDSALMSVLFDTSKSGKKIVSTLQELILSSLSLPMSDSAACKKSVKQLLNAYVGLQVNCAELCNITDISKEDKELLKIRIDSDSADEELQKVADSGLLEDAEIEIIYAVYEEYKRVTLHKLLAGQTSISEAMISRYNTHKENWDVFKKLCLQVAEQKNAQSTKKHSKQELKQQRNDFYTILTHWASAKEEDVKKARKYFEDVINNADITDAQKDEYLATLEDNSLFPIQRSKDNGVIPYQLHLHELRQILDKQGKYYPFLNQTFEFEGKQVRRIERLITFRVPYYVGPLVAPNDMQQSDNAQNHWMIRKADRVAITPWNFDEVVDKKASGQAFIQRLVGTDTYLLGEPTVAKNSLLYQKFAVYDELNNARVTTDIDTRKRRFSFEEKKLLLRALFMQKRSVSRVDAQKVLQAQYGIEYHISGLSEETKFANSLKSYCDLLEVSKGLACDEQWRKFVQDSRNEHILEEILTAQTIFEDKKTLLLRLQTITALEAYPKELVERLAKIHYTGWGNLSKKLLTSKICKTKLMGESVPEYHSIIEVLEATSNNLS